MNRIVCWFSCGAASAVATKLMLAENAGRLPVVIVYTEVAEEHPDNKRFLADCESWFSHPIMVIRNEKYNASIYEVFRREQFLVGPRGAACTRLLKRGMREAFERDFDIQVFGFTAEEQERSAEFFERNEYMTGRAPLIERGVGKADCLAMLQDAGIEIPTMYHLGYRNNNCIGCVKGGAGYWNKIRKDFPETFARMAAVERKLGRTIIRVDGDPDADGKPTRVPMYLDQLPEGMGSHQDEQDIECSIFCHMAKQEYSA